MRQSGSDAAGRTFMVLDEGRHTARYTFRRDGEYDVTCSCGATWSHGREKTVEEMEATFAAHEAYDRKAGTVTL
jgi:hypothetical protein